MSMGWNTQSPNLPTGALLLAGLIATHAAVAAPPVHIHLQTRPQPSAQAQAQALQHLDLRAPLHIPEAADSALDRSFPSRRPNLAAQAAVQLPALGVEGVRTRPTVQEFVRRVRQEGLPVARLFEGKSALVHLGLNPKGKPGLWLVQKTR
jgi:hypothetical protein